MKDSHQNRQDCELFLQAFEKPTQIYRYLRMRRLFSPLFLQRNLVYLKDRVRKQRKCLRRQRKNFDWQTFLKELKPLKSSDPSDSSLVFKFLGYFDEKTSIPENDTATVNIYVLSRSKHQPKFLLKTIPVEINPRIIINPVPITLSKEELMRNVSRTDRSCELVIEVSYIEHQNNDEHSDKSQRSKKRKKISHDARLPVFDKKGHCDLLEGEYELNLDLSRETTPIRKVDRLTWASDIPKVLTGDKRYYQNRSLKFMLLWNSEDGTKSKSTSPIHNENAMLNTSNTTDWCGIQTGSTTSLSTSSGILSDMSSDDAEISTLTTKKLPNTLPITLTNRSPFVDILKKYNIGSHLIYRFIYNDDLSQKTEAWDEFLCPWCYLNCISLHPLLMHLRLCHDRFKFSYTQKEDGIQLDVSINERYMCALSPLKENAIESNENDTKPCKRKPYTKVLVSRPRAKKYRKCTTFEELDEAFESDVDSSDVEENKYVLPRGQLNFDGHRREYYRTTNNTMYTHRADFDDDSEGEMDPIWLRQHTRKLIDDFTDVNEGEKEMLTMWNLHAMKHNFVGDSQMPLACEMFVNERGDEILAKNLYRNFLLHLTNLHDFGMLSAGQIREIVQRLQVKQKNRNQSRFTA